MRLLLTASEGTAHLVAEECRALGLKINKVRQDAVEATGGPWDLARALVWLRTAERVLFHLHSFECHDAKSLYEGASAVDWPRWIDASISIGVLTTGKLPHGRRGSKAVLKTHVFASQVIKDAVVDAVRAVGGRRPDVHLRSPDVRIIARIFGDRCGLFLDAAGQPLNWRGYRHSSVPAPLSETMAAAMLADAGYTGERHVLDPMCGSGTIAIEAAMIAAGIAPGAERSFGIEQWPMVPDTFTDALATIRGKARRDRRKATREPSHAVTASDIDPEAVDAARTNARMAGVDGWIQFSEADVTELPQPTKGTLVATNPPYGERVGSDVAELYTQMGKRMALFNGCDIAILDGHESFPDAFGLTPARSSKVRNGPLRVLLHHIPVGG